MKSRRKLTPEEQKEIARRLERLDESTAKTFEHPIGDLIANLKRRKDNRNHEVEEEDGRAVRYFLHFTSPPWTWQMLCGAAGVYTVEANSLAAIDFELTRLS